MSEPTEAQVQELYALFSTMARRFKLAEAQAMPGKPLNQIDIQTLLFIADNPGAGPTDVARHLAVAATTMTSATDRLSRQGLLHRERPPENRRSIALSLTGRGEEVVEALVEAQVIGCREMLARLDPHEQEQILAYCRKIASTEPPAAG